MKGYQKILVESYYTGNVSGLHGTIHIRPLPNQDPYLTSYHVECSKTLSNDYPPGTIFEIHGKITNREGGSRFIYSHYLWPFKIKKLGNVSNSKK